MNNDLHSQNSRSKNSISQNNERSFKYNMYRLYNPIPYHMKILNKERLKKAIKKKYIEQRLIDIYKKELFETYFRG